MKVVYQIIFFLKSLTPPILWKLFKKMKPERKYYGLNDLDKKMEKYLNYRGGYFVELGSNNGVNQSNTYFYEKKKNWNGILIEPVLHNYLECRKNRSSKNKFFCCACVSEQFNNSSVEMIYSDLMTIPINLESDIVNKVKHANHSNTIREPEKRIDPVKFIVKARTLTDIFEEANAPRRMDFLSLDVEGAEIEVLKGINFNKYNFKYILVETRNLETISTFLKKYKYKIKDKLSHHDYLFVNFEI